jgi:hypothetical protein
MKLGRLICYGLYRFENNFINISSLDIGINKFPHKNGCRLRHRTEVAAQKMVVSGSTLFYSDGRLSLPE